MVVRPKIYGRGNQRSEADRDADDRATRLRSMARSSSAKGHQKKVTLPPVSIQKDDDAPSKPDRSGR